MKLSKLPINLIVRAKLFGPSNASIGREHWRIVGAKDIDGRGTEHPIRSIDPFIFLDESLVPAKAQGLGGGFHPHAGLTAFTYLSPDVPGVSSSKAVLNPRDNFGSDFGGKKNNAGGLYVVQSGGGLVHNEVNETESGFMHQLQLWTIDPSSGFWDTDTDEKKEPAKPSTQLYQPGDIPVVALIHDTGPAHGQVRVMVGQYGGQASPAVAPVPMLYLHATVFPRTSTDSKADVFTIPKGFHGFVYMLKGGCKVNGAQLNSREVGIFNDAGHGGVLEVASGVGEDASEGTSFVIVAGKPLGKAFYKILGSGGALITSSEGQCREVMRTFDDAKEKDLMLFGHVHDGSDGNDGNEKNSGIGRL